jgi:caffeoyl-CoA O-methyltransferase
MLGAAVAAQVIEPRRWYGPAAGRLLAVTGFRPGTAQVAARPKMHDPLSWKISSSYGRKLSTIMGNGCATDRPKRSGNDETGGGPPGHCDSNIDVVAGPPLAQHSKRARPRGAPGPEEGNRVDIVNPAVSDYLLTHCSPADDLLRDLAAETRAAFGGAAAMQVSHDEGELLTMLTRLVGARRAVEVGVFTGYSSICIARGMPAGGHLLACDVSDRFTSVARRYWKRAGLDDRIELRVAPALDTLRALPTDPVLDVAFIDADKTSYPLYYEELVTRLRPGGLIIIDNVLYGGEVLDPAPSGSAQAAVSQLNDAIVADARVESVMLPVRDGVTLARRR